MIDKYTKLFLSAQSALLEEVIPSLRGMAVDWDEDTICLYFYHDGQVTEEIEEGFQEVAALIIADFDKAKLDENFIQLDYPAPLPKHKHWVYKRKERAL